MNKSDSTPYEILQEFYKTLSDAGYEKSEEIDPNKEIPKINRKLNFFNNVLIAVILVLGLAFLGFVVDAIYFHISNNNHYENK